MQHRRRARAALDRRLRSIVCLLCLMFVASCGKPVLEMDLQPAQARTEFAADGDQQTLYNCPLNTMGCAPPGNTAQAGFYNAYKPGTAPLACWQWVGCFYRGFATFDLAPLSGKGVVSAQLQWTNKTQKAGGTVATNEGHCLQSLFVATAPWDGLGTPGQVLFGSLQGNQAAQMSFEVGPTVRNWALDQQPNHGFFVVGLKEGFTPKSGDVCTTVLQNLRLHVFYTD